MSKNNKRPEKNKYGLKRLLGVVLMLTAAAATYACLNDVTHGILVFFKEELTKYLGEYAVIVPILFFLIGLKIFFDARINASKKELSIDSEKILLFYFCKI